MSAPKRILLIAYHFPPLAGSSGIQRTLRFAQQLPQFGWQPLVLTASSRAYERCDDSLNRELPADLVVERAFALDSARHLSLKGRYWGALARPDRWMSWRFDAVRRGMAMIRRYQPQFIWSTYPIATAHQIGAALARRSGLPWIADFRDPMAQEDYPRDPQVWQAFKAIEEKAFSQARHCVLTTPGATRLYRARYPQSKAQVHCIENGYDEDSFPRQPGTEGPLIPGCITLLHSGIVYPAERDPSHLMQALRQLHQSGRIQPGRLKLRFRAAVHDALLLRLAQEQGVTEYLELAPAVPYREALAEMLRADGLLVMQDRGCNDQVPAKIYEYLRAGRPILALTDPAGDTAGVLRGAGLDQIAELDDANAIAARLEQFLAAIQRQDPALQPQAQAVQAASRLARTQKLAELLDLSLTPTP